MKDIKHFLFCKHQVNKLTKNQSKYIKLDCPLNNDVWAYSLIGSNGFFVEIGAGQSGNSSFILERFFNWSGILIEPCKSFIPKLQIFRPKSKIINKLISNIENQKIDFFEYSPDKHYSSINLNTLNKKTKKYNKKQSHSINKICYLSTTLQSVLDKEKITKIDYLALDAEGSELKILEGLSLDKVRPKLISSESNMVRNFLLSKNYKEVENPFKNKEIKYEFYFKDNLHFEM